MRINTEDLDYRGTTTTTAAASALSAVHATSRRTGREGDLNNARKRTRTHARKLQLQLSRGVAPYEEENSGDVRCCFSGSFSSCYQGRSTEAVAAPRRSQAGDLHRDSPLQRRSGWKDVTRLFFGGIFFSLLLSLLPFLSLERMQEIPVSTQAHTHLHTQAENS